MKIGIVSDIHGNLPGLEMALDIMGPIDKLLCPGDAFDENSFSNDVVRRLRQLDAHYVLGNHEDIFFSSAGSRARNQPNVDKELVDWVAARPHYLELEFEGKELELENKTLLLFHSTPWEPYGDYVFPHMTDKLERFSQYDANYMVYGHTHSQLLKQSNDTLIINPGSAGHGRDPNNDRHLSCCVLDTDSDAATIHNYPDPRLGL